jgi:hypothetical protein
VGTRTIYVELIDDGVDVWRPVQAELESDRIFRLPQTAPADETWRFPPGSRVRCELCNLYDGQHLLATELLP